MPLSPNTKVHFVDSFDVAADCKRWLSTTSEVAIDTEGTGLNVRRDKVRLLQLGDRETAYCIPLDFPGWGGLGKELITRYEGDYVAHNLTYDAYMIKNTLGVSLPKHRCHDTRLMAHVLESTGSLALKNLAARHVDRRSKGWQGKLEDTMAKGKWNWSTIPIDHPDYWLYGGLDTILTMNLKDELFPRVQATAPQSYALELAVAWVAKKMEMKGLLLDREYAEKLSDELTVYVDAAERWCKETFGVSPGSNQNIIRVLQDAGVVFTKMTDGGAWSLDKEVLSSIDHPLASTVLSRRQSQKVVSTYLGNYLAMAEEDGRIHPSINTVGGTDKNQFEPGGGNGVRTGRMSCSDPNMQNVPIRTKMGKKIRNCFWVPEGHSWVKCDADQIEMRVMTHMSGDKGMREAFLGDEDFFVALAKQLFDEPNFVKSDPRRQMVKNGGYAKIYSAGIEKFSKTAGVSESEGGQFMRTFDKLFPGVPEWTRRIEMEARQRHQSEGDAYAVSPLTGRRHYAEMRKLYPLVNYLIQGTAGEILKMKMVEADAAGLDEFMMLPVHDEIDLEVPNDQLDDVLATLGDVMNDDKMLTVPITWSSEVGARWGECV